ncbi:MAG: TonB-dependent receptor [Bacteroidales bacterium]|nr:TonB-dependent receptor [Bacteroidales bacterium]MBR0083801.1 TonB-dependent receptor [Bacteroidales bacterium]
MRLPKILSLAALLLLGSLGLGAQNRTVQGTVSDSSGQPLPGVGVLLQGTTNGTVTGTDGTWQLRVPDSDVILDFSSLGYQSQTVNVPASQGVVNVTMADDNLTLEETVVVGYGVQKKVNLTGAITAVESSQLENRSSHNLTTMLQGSVPGLNISTSSGNPGSTGSLNIRGYTSINGGDPLVLIDGIEGNINRINPQDVASISVIKDASSAAVYGARAAYGVILVTTKDGGADKNKATVRYNGRWGVERPTTSTDWETTGYWSVYTLNKFWYESKGSNYVNYSAEDMRELLARVHDKTENPERPWTIIKDGKYKYYANTDWWHELYNDYHPTQNHSISISGGNKAVKYYLSGQYDRQQGMVKARPDVYEKYNLRAKIDARINKYARISNNTNFFVGTYDFPGLADIQDSFAYGDRHAPACFPLKNPDGTWVYFVDALGYRVANGRHWAYASNNVNIEKRTDFANTTELTITPIKQLTLKANYSYRTYINHDTHRRNLIEYSQYPGQTVVYNNAGAFDNYMTEKNSENIRQTWNVYGTYENTFGENHNFKAMIGANYDAYHYKDVWSKGYDLISTELSDLDLISTATRPAETNGGQTAWSTLGFFGRLNYDYAGRYLLEVSARYDGSSRFAAGHKWGFFPSVSAGWRISEEPFFAPVKHIVNNLKLRASYGTLGNQNVANYSYIRLVNFNTFSAYNFGDNVMARYTNLDAPVASDKTWETSKQTNIGLDVAMWGNKLEFTAEAYIRDTDGMLTDGMDLPAVYGASVPQMNAADLRTKGYELSLSWRDSFKLAGSNFEYFVKPTLSEFRSNITKFKNETKLLSNYYEGMEIGEIWGFHVDGLFASDAEAAEYTSRVDQSYFNANLNGGWKAGDLKYADLGGNITEDADGNVISNEPDGIVGIGKNTLKDHGDLIYLGNSLPRLHYGLQTGFSWMGFDVSVFFEGTGDHYWYPARYNFDFWGPYSLGYPTFLAKNFLDNCWSEDNPNAYFPRPRSNVASNGSGELGRVNDRYIQNIRYLRFKNLTVGYALPKKLISHIGLEGLRIYFSGENLAYWSPITKVTDHLDPESCFNRGGSATDDLNNTSYPWQKTFMLGVDITF